MKYSSVEELLSDIGEDKHVQVNALRDIITSAVTVSEHIKWNAPSYVYDGEDRVTFNLHGDDIKIMIHMGATKKEDKSAPAVLKDEVGLVKWNSNIRGTISFDSLEDIMIKRLDFIDILQRWVKLS